MLTWAFIIIGIVIYTLYAAAQNRRLTRINRQLAILLEMKQYEIEKAESSENYDAPPGEM